MQPFLWHFCRLENLRRLGRLGRLENLESLVNLRKTLHDLEIPNLSKHPNFPKLPYNICTPHSAVDCKIFC